MSNLTFEQIKKIKNKKEKTTELILFEKSLIKKKQIFISPNFYKINSNINTNEGEFILNIIEKYNCINCLEIGMAFGISSLYILSSNKIINNLISIDPFQKLQWNNFGKNLLKFCGLNTRHKLIEKKSYEVLPLFLNKHSGVFDFIFIDGFHTFDYTLLDFFYSSLLIKKNGIIIIDDALHKSVNKCIHYITTNYLHFKKINSPPTVACFIKVDNDTREWNFHNNF